MIIMERAELLKENRSNYGWRSIPRRVLDCGSPLPLWE